MALIECMQCHKQYTDQIDVCPHCGFVRRQRLYCPECQYEISSNVASCPNCGLVFAKLIKYSQPAYQQGRQNQRTNYIPNKITHDVVFQIKTPKVTAKVKKIIGVSVAILVLTITSSVLIKKWIGAYEKQLIELKSGNVEQVYYWASRHPNSYKHSELLRAIDDAFEEKTLNCMEAGDYISAQKCLDYIPHIENHDKIQEQIIYESYALKCAEVIRPYYKNPSSFKYTKITFYKSSNGNPDCVAVCSGQNGFGGFNSSNALFLSLSSGEYDYFGSCEYLVPMMNDEVEDMVVAFQIEEIIKHEIIKSLDVARVNRVLASGNTILIDTSLYSTNTSSI